MDTEQLKNVVEAWKTTVEVQQHFNDLELRIRSFALTILGVLLSAAAVAIKEYDTGFIAPMLLVVALVLWAMFYMMDYYWYHQLLKGAVDHGLFIEKKLNSEFPELGLATAIGQKSKVEIRGKIYDSNKRMRTFYGIIAAVLVLFFVAMIVFQACREKPNAEKKDQQNYIVIKQNASGEIQSIEAVNSNSAEQNANSANNNTNSSNVSPANNNANSKKELNTNEK